MPHLQDRHARDRGARLVQGSRVDSVVGPDDEDDVGLGEVGVDLVHLEHDVVRHPSLGEQHVHVAGEPACDRVDAETHHHTPFAELLRQFRHGVLRLRDRHPVARRDHDRPCVGEQLGDLVGLHLAVLAVVALLPGDGAVGAEAAGDDTDERAVHRLAHDVAEDRTGRAHQGAHDDEQVVAEHEAGSGRGPARVGVEHRDDDGHVAAADGRHEVEAEQQSQRRHRDQRDEAQVALDRNEPREQQRRRDEDREVEQVSTRQRQGRRLHPRAELEVGHDRAGEGHRPDEDAEEHLDVVDGAERAVEVVDLEVGVEAHQHGSEADEAVQDRHQLGHAGHLDRPGPPGSDDRTDGHGHHDQHHRHGERALVAELAVAGSKDERGNEREAHAGHAEGVAAARRLVLGEPAQGEDEEDRREDVGGLDQAGQSFGAQEVHRLSPSGTSAACERSPGSRRRC